MGRFARRYEGKWQNVGFTAGGGYTHVQLEDNTVADPNLDDFNQWNLGANSELGSFQPGRCLHDQDNGGVSDDGKNRTWVVGVDYTDRPVQAGHLLPEQPRRPG